MLKLKYLLTTSSIILKISLVSITDCRGQCFKKPEINTIFGFILTISSFINGKNKILLHCSEILILSAFDFATQTFQLS